MKEDNHLVHLEGKQTLYYLPETAGLTVSEEYLTTSEGIVGLDHHRLHRNKSVHELLVCFVFIYLFIYLNLYLPLV